ILQIQDRLFDLFSAVSCKRRSRLTRYTRERRWGDSCYPSLPKLIGRAEAPVAPSFEIKERRNSSQRHESDRAPFTKFSIASIGAISLRRNCDTMVTLNTDTGEDFGAGGFPFRVKSSAPGDNILSLFRYTIHQSSTLYGDQSFPSCTSPPSNVYTNNTAQTEARGTEHIFLAPVSHESASSGTYKVALNFQIVSRSDEDGDEGGNGGTNVGVDSVPKGESSLRCPRNAFDPRSNFQTTDIAGFEFSENLLSVKAASSANAQICKMLVRYLVDWEMIIRLGEKGATRAVSPRVNDIGIFGTVEVEYIRGIPYVSIALSGMKRHCVLKKEHNIRRYDVKNLHNGILNEDLDFVNCERSKGEIRRSPPSFDEDFLVENSYLTLSLHTYN
ncbi:hypothetical protein SISSUDRAFT_1038582, partial [Sistotremastrum suecicum HHB10207 ss-3]